MSRVNIQYLPVDSLKPYARNPRNNEEAIKHVAESIREFGFKVPIVVDEDYVIVSGHTRLLASKELGYKEVPVIIADDLTDEQVKAFRLADNKVSEVSQWDEALLKLEMMELENMDMSKFGFEEDLFDEPEKKTVNKKNLKEMELRSFEHHDYIVFAFENQQDWMWAVNQFGLERVDAGYGTTKKVGVGRVIDGKRLLEKIGHTDSDIEPE